MDAWKNSNSKNHYLKNFIAATTIRIDCFPQQKRWNNGIAAKVRGKDSDNH